MCYGVQIFELLTEFKKIYKVIPMYKTLLNSCDSEVSRIVKVYIFSIYTVYLEKEYENSRLFQQYYLSEKLYKK